MGYVRNVLCLVNVYPEVFGRPQWQFSQVLYIYYRYLFAFYVIGWDVFITIRGSYQYGGWYQIDLKVWTFHLLALYAFISVVTALVHWVRVAKWRYEDFLRKDSSPAIDSVLNTSQNSLGITADQSIYPSNPWYFKLDWLLFNLNISLHPIVTILFWIHARNDNVFSSDDKSDILAVAHLTIVNTALIVLDLFIRRIPVYILQAAYPMTVWIIYIIVNVIVHFANAPGSQEFIYSDLFNWSADNVAPSISFAVAFLFGILLVHLLAYFLFKFRTALFLRCCKDVGYYDSSGVSLEMSSGLCCSVCGRGQDSHNFVFNT
ncbi:Protein rolling stone [Holothuria leucospilota]|uniref:Protein rolling stone n=1 Tax=Holothuria leucospilota TaxID=206669 RepID=A0A9Q1CET0_HOLLE|nr:Protein rolling stone [Holothuria leucospilota]